MALVPTLTPRLLPQVLRKRLQAWTERLGSEVNGEGVRPEAGAAVAELQTQMGELEQSISNHQKTLEMTRKLQQAMEEVLLRLLLLPAQQPSSSLTSCVCANSFSSGVRRPAPPSAAWTSSPHSVAEQAPFLLSSSSLRPLCGRRSRSRRRG